MGYSVNDLLAWLNVYSSEVHPHLWPQLFIWFKTIKLAALRTKPLYRTNTSV